MLIERGFEVDHSSVHRWMHQARTVVRESLSQVQAPGWQELEDGCNLRQDARPVEVLVSRCELGWQDRRFHASGPS
jgi:hypothetical protein